MSNKTHFFIYLNSKQYKESQFMASTMTSCYKIKQDEIPVDKSDEEATSERLFLIE